jgi:Tfp pilus assembly protein PilW
MTTASSAVSALTAYESSSGLTWITGRRQQAANTARTAQVALRMAGGHGQIKAVVHPPNGAVRSCMTKTSNSLGTRPWFSCRRSAEIDGAIEAGQIERRCLGSELLMPFTPLLPGATVSVRPVTSFGLGLRGRSPSGTLNP